MVQEVFELLFCNFGRHPFYYETLSWFSGLVGFWQTYLNYAKAERLTSKNDGRLLEIFKLEIKDDTEAEALITENLTCPKTGIIYRVEEFRTPIPVQQCWNC